jgi:hypothetical protein
VTGHGQPPHRLSRRLGHRVPRTIPQQHRGDNLAVAGRSIQTWLYEGGITANKNSAGECALSSTTASVNWQKVLDGMKAGDTAAGHRLDLVAEGGQLCLVGDGIGEWMLVPVDPDFLQFGFLGGAYQLGALPGQLCLDAGLLGAQVLQVLV